MSAKIADLIEHRVNDHLSAGFDHFILIIPCRKSAIKPVSLTKKTIHTAPYMSRSTLLSILLFCSIASWGQNLSVTFTGTGAATQIDSVTATNLTTNQSVTLPGNETLVLTVNTGVPSIPELTNMGMVFPNPFSGKATFTTIVQKPQSVYLKVQNLVGQVVAQSKAYLQSGENEFSLSVTPAGIYIVTLSTELETASYKVICTEASSEENSIQLRDKGPDQDKNPAQSGLKGSLTGYSLGYTFGDVVLYRCMSGIYTTILTGSPTSNDGHISRNALSAS